ncbi:unnamed protein product [Lampetra planeri]
MQHEVAHLRSPDHSAEISTSSFPSSGGGRCTNPRRLFEEVDKEEVGKKVEEPLLHFVKFENAHIEWSLHFIRERLLPRAPTHGHHHHGHRHHGHCHHGHRQHGHHGHHHHGGRVRK